MTRSKTSILASFDPRMTTLLVRAATQEQRFPFASRRDATKFVARLNRLRKLLLDAKHDNAEIASRSQCVIEQPKDRSGPDEPAIVFVRPHDSQFDTVLRGFAGESKPLTSDPLAEFAKDK